MDNSNMIRVTAIVVIASILVYVLWDYGARHRSMQAEKFDTAPVAVSAVAAMEAQASKAVRFAEPSAMDSAVRGDSSAGAEEVNFPNKRQMPENCYPRERLTADDLLPKDAANTKWAQVNPAGQGDLRDRNFLNAGYHVGINTIGSSMRNPNMSLRSEPPNPQLKVSPWSNSTIAPDLLRKKLDDDTCA